MKKLVLGIMSGTSLDSVDYALCEIEENDIQLRELWSVGFPDQLRETLHSAARNGLRSYALAQAHHDLGRFYARHAAQNKSKIKPDFIGLHGQTVFHNPDKKNRATLQLGEPAYLAETLRVPVVSNFRAADIAAGGQGAPLATIFHQFVFARKGRHVCVNNLGGISNVTALDFRDADAPRILAFDTGPGNVLMDMTMRYLTDGRRQMDRGGRWAARGKPCERVLRQWLDHPYFLQSPPKSTGRELFGEPFFRKALAQVKGLSRFDVLATFTELAARSLEINYRLHLDGMPDRVILTGGGASNPTLVKAITRNFPGVEVVTSEALGWPVQAIEAAAFALLAYLRMEKKPANLPQTTGAHRAALLGQVTEY